MEFMEQRIKSLQLNENKQNAKKELKVAQSSHLTSDHDSDRGNDSKLQHPVTALNEVGLPIPSPYTVSTSSTLKCNDLGSNVLGFSSTYTVIR